MKNAYKLAILTFCFTAIISCSSNILQSSDNDLSIKNSLKLLLKDYYNNQDFNGNILVSRNGKIIYSDSFGYAEPSKSIELTSSHQFNLGSIYKEFPAVSIMQLKEKNLLDLSDTLDQYLPEYPEWSKKVTLKSLLQYTSGLPRIQWGKHQNISDENVFHDLQQLEELEFEPGSSYLYTNYSPLILQKIVESITKKTFIEYANNNLFYKSKMIATHLDKQFPYQDRKLKAIPYNSDLEEDTFPLQLSLLYSSTSEDMNAWLENLHSNNLINKESINALAELPKLDIAKMQSALGDVVYSNDRLIRHSHHGSSGNFEALIIRDMTKNATIVMMTNQKKGQLHKLSNEIFQLL